MKAFLSGCKALAIICGVSAVGLSVAARAQNASIQATPLPPLQQQWQREGSPPVQEGPPGSIPRSQSSLLTNQPFRGPGQQDQAQQDPNQLQAPAGPVPPPATLERANVWVPATVAKLQALDKVNAQTSRLTLKVGQSVTFGSLTITVKSCMVRPADQPEDAAAFLDVTDSHPDAPGFDGWMLEDEPSVSMMQHPIYDLRVVGCA